MEVLEKNIRVLLVGSHHSLIGAGDINDSNQQANDGLQPCYVYECNTEPLAT